MRRHRRSCSSTAAARGTAGTSSSRGRQRIACCCRSIPGFGDSGDLDDLREVHDLVLHYTELFDQLGLTGDVNLVGLSLGGLLAARFAIEQKHRLRRLVLVAPTGLRVPGREVDDLFRFPPEELPRTTRPPHRNAAAAPARRPPRCRLHRRPLPRGADDGADAVGASVRSGRAPLARPRRHPEPRRVGRGRRLVPRRWRRRGQRCSRTARWRRSPPPAISSSTSRRTAVAAVAGFCAPD